MANGGPVSNVSSGSNTPSPPQELAQVDGAAEHRSANRTHTVFLSRSASPASLGNSGMGSRSESPINFGYPYRQNHGGIFPESQTPQAIHG